MIKDVLRYLRSSTNMKQDELAAYLNIKRSTYTRYESGTIQPDAIALSKLADLYNVSVDFILERQADDYSFEERRLLKAFKTASTYARGLAFYALDSSSGCSTKDATQTEEEFAIDYYPDYPVSAGVGNFIDDTQKETLILSQKPPHGACFVNVVTGDSMEPMFYGGDKVFVSPEPVSEGQIGVFFYDNVSYIKKLGRGELISVNPLRDNIKIENPERFFCLGKVLGKVDESTIK